MPFADSGTEMRTEHKRAREAGVQDVPSWQMHIDIVEMDTRLVQMFQHAGDPLDKVRDDLCGRSRAHLTSSCASRSAVWAATMRWRIGRCAALLATPI
jgi:hypothetical protein